MGNAKVFLVGESEDKLIPMDETPYSKEGMLQGLIADYPDLLPGDQIDPEQPRRWLLVKKECGIPGEKEGRDIGSVDHLFLDQDGIPTFVECKRAANAQSRRQVVAQMLDYAANGTKYLRIDWLRQVAAETARKQKKLLDKEISRLLGNEVDADIEGYWQGVGENLRNRKVRLLFVADEIPLELKRLVEFLDKEMQNVKVLAVEIKQFSDPKNNHKAVVPRVIGLTDTGKPPRTSMVNCEKQMSGIDIWDAEKNTHDGSDNYKPSIIGRKGGIKRLREDIIKHEWKEHLYETNSKRALPRINWFPVEEFVNLVKQLDNPSEKGVSDKEDGGKVSG